MIPPHTKAIPLNRLPVVRKHGEALFLPAMVSAGSGPVAKSRRREGFRPVRQGGALPFRPARRPMPAVPAAALPPRSAPRSEHFARLEGKASETPRGAAGGDAATPSQSFPSPHAARAKKRAALYKTLRPAHPHRTPRPGHFSRGRKVSVLRRTTWGGPASPWPGGVPVLPSGAQNAPRFRFSRAVCPCCRVGRRRPGFALAGRCGRQLEFVSKSATIKA